MSENKPAAQAGDELPPNDQRPLFDPERPSEGYVSDAEWRARIDRAALAARGAQAGDGREAFEARFPDARAHWNDIYGRYLSTIYERAWEAWQAARKLG